MYDILADFEIVKNQCIQSLDSSIDYSRSHLLNSPTKIVFAKKQGFEFRHFIPTTR